MVRRLTIKVIRAFANPTVIVSVLGPTIIAVNIQWLRSSIGEGSEILAVLTNPWAEAVREHSIQLYTLFLAVVIFQPAAIRWLWHLIREHHRTLKDEDLFHALSTFEVVWILMLIIQLLGFAYLFISGVLATPEVITMYAPPEVPKRLHPPPMDSPITWLRGVVAFLGFVQPSSVRRKVHEA